MSSRKKFASNPSLSKRNPEKAQFPNQNDEIDEDISESIPLIAQGQSLSPSFVEKKSPTYMLFSTQIPQLDDDIKTVSQHIPSINWTSVRWIVLASFLTRLFVVSLMIVSPLVLGRASTDADFQHLYDQWTPPMMQSQLNTQIQMNLRSGSGPYIDAPYT